MKSIMKEAKIYIDKLWQINLSREFGRTLKEARWDNGSKIYMYYDPNTDEIRITNSMLKAAMWLEKVKDGAVMWLRQILKHCPIFSYLNNKCPVISMDTKTTANYREYVPLKYIL
jgi:hypothetical protein